VSILPEISKFCERAINDQLVFYFSKIFHPYLSAFRSGYGCQTALLKIEKLICDKFNLEALTVNQVKVSKLWQTGKMFSLEPKREVANRCHMRAK
jgi:hypothetical protein